MEQIQQPTKKPIGYRALSESQQDPTPRRKRGGIKQIEIPEEEQPIDKVEGVVTLGEFEGETGREREQKKIQELAILEKGFESSTPADLYKFISMAEKIKETDPDIKIFPELSDKYDNLIGKAMNLLKTKNILDLTTKEILDLRKNKLSPEQNFAAKEEIINRINTIVSIAKTARSTGQIKKFIDDLNTLKESLYQ
ncbi:MAG: hypothetical protein PHC97_02500 [Patescibacteria group bacterium]|nr:hypothetical protein [Patescibacteria group bacterium]